MKYDMNTHITILGMGYLMEYIRPCYSAFLGDRCREQIIAVTADEKDLARKNEVLGFPVILNDNLGALEKNEPRIILLAPPPPVAPSLINEVLLPYFAEVRAKGAQLPMIFAFPPTPTGDYYLEKLGKDVRIVNVLPNMVSKIAGEKLNGEGLTYLTYPNDSAWTEEEKAFVQQFFAPMGGCIEVPPQHVMQMLAGTVTVHLISETIFTITDALAQGGHPVDYQKIASAMRAYHRKKWGWTTGDYPCSEFDVDPYLAHWLKKVAYHWYMGTLRFYLDCGMEEQTARTILTSLLDLHLQIHQREERPAIEKKGSQHATKGGVLEKGGIMFARLVETGLKKEFYVFPDMRLTDEWCAWYEDRAYQITKIVSDHGARLSTNRTCQKYQIENHALTFAYFAKRTLESGIPGAAEALQLAVVRYARERGSRMRQRCDRFGDPVNMLSYKVYCEWCPECEDMSAITIQKSPVHKTEVTRCRWVDVWNKYGYSQYGKYYCDYADYNLVKGFSDDMKLEMGKVFSRGADCCAFTWCGADMTPENEAWVSKRRGELMNTVTFDWEYHTAHLYHTMAAVLTGALGAGAKEIIRRVREDYANEFTEESLSIIDSFDHMDFKCALYNENTQVRESSGLLY